MRFRVVVAIALWTMLSGPVLGPPTNSAPPHHTPAASSASAPTAPDEDPDATP
jgi:hypothetical protein